MNYNVIIDDDGNIVSTPSEIKKDQADLNMPIIMDGIIGSVLSELKCSNNFVRHRGIVFHNNIPFVLMDIARGYSLKMFLKKHGLDLDKKRSVALQILNSLDCAYTACEFTHNDLSLNWANVIISYPPVSQSHEDTITYPNGVTVKMHGVFPTIIDFGSSKIAVKGRIYAYGEDNHHKTCLEDLIDFMSVLKVIKKTDVAHIKHYKELLIFLQEHI